MATNTGVVVGICWGVTVHDTRDRTMMAQDQVTFFICFPYSFTSKVAAQRFVLVVVGRVSTGFRHGERETNRQPPARQPGVDSAWEQEKLEATLREMLINRARAKRSPQRPVHLRMMRASYFTEETAKKLFLRTLYWARFTLLTTPHYIDSCLSG